MSGDLLRVRLLYERNVSRRANIPLQLENKFPAQELKAATLYWSHRQSIFLFSFSRLPLTALIETLRLAEGQTSRNEACQPKKCIAPMVGLQFKLLSVILFAIWVTWFSLLMCVVHSFSMYRNCFNLYIFFVLIATRLHLLLPSTDILNLFVSSSR